MTMQSMVEIPVQPEQLPVQQPAQPLQLTENQKNAWLGMALSKMALSVELGKIELEGQGILLTIKDSEEYAKIDDGLALYRKVCTKITDTRVPFTNMIQAKLIDPLMEPEKRLSYKSNAEYLRLTQKSLTLRKTEADATALTNTKNQAIANFKTHCVNEWYRVGELLRNKIRYEITSQYTLHLQQRLSPELDKIKAAINSTIIPIPDSNKFQVPVINGTPVLSGEELMQIYTSLNKPDFNQPYIDGHALVDQTFANFDSDLANVPQAIAHVQQHTAMAELEGSQNVAEVTAMNTLIIQSDAVTIEGPKISKTVQIIVVESEQWAKNIMGAFITNLPKLTKYIRTKSWSNLTVGQMAGYLSKYSTDNNIRITGLDYTEIEK